jgi:hypothetical protein
MKQIKVRMPDEMIEIIKRVANELALTLDDSTMSFSAALRFLVRRGAQDYYGNGHNPEVTECPPHF